MSTKSFAALMARLESTAEGQAARVSVNFLAQVHTRMQALGLSSAELAQRMGTSPAYITRLFRGSANLSVETMVKLARAVESTLQVALNAQPTPETVAAMVEARNKTAARYNSAQELFDALDQETNSGKVHAAAKKV
jgi:plasmid maintenance system antidote protein VapI